MGEEVDTCNAPRADSRTSTPTTQTGPPIWPLPGTYQLRVDHGARVQWRLISAVEHCVRQGVVGSWQMQGGEGIRIVQSCGPTVYQLVVGTGWNKHGVAAQNREMERVRDLRTARRHGLHGEALPGTWLALGPLPETQSANRSRGYREATRSCTKLVQCHEVKLRTV